MTMPDWCLVVLNGPSGDLVPDLPVPTWGCNGNFLRRRIDHLVCLDLPRVRLARQHRREIWTRPRFCRSGDHAIPDQGQLFNDGGNAAIWAASQTHDHIVVIGADAWLGGQTRTVCDELYEVSTKKTKLAGVWRRRFLTWSQAMTTQVSFVWPHAVPDFKTITLHEFSTKYTV